jgi:D-3-phosphoglycerate dehydrogenase
MKVHILDDWFDTLKTLPSFNMLNGHDVTIWTDHTEDLDTLSKRLQPAEALILFRERTAIRAPLLERLPNLRLISQRSVYPHIDIQSCTANGVLVCSNQHGDTPSYAAAELTFALILATARQIPQQMSALQAGRWQLAPGQTLRGRRLGLYGYGRIGREVAVYARAFGMEVIWWASEAGRQRALADGEQIAPSRTAFFAESDFVSLHVRLKPETRGIIKLEDLLVMKPSAGFINTSRSGLIVPGAIEVALEAGRPGRFALDVYDREPMTSPVDPLVLHPNVIATPHIGYVTEDEIDLQFSDIYEQVNAFAAGSPIHVINPSALGHAVP